LKNFIGFLVCILPSFLGVLLLRASGHKVGKNVKIGFSFLKSKQIIFGDNVRIGHFNLILNQSINLHNRSNIGYLNILKGPFNLILKPDAAIGNKNYFTRGYKGITYGESTLSLGELTKITTEHHLDLTRSISFGKFSILAGVKSQIWTHGYYHADLGKDRIRIDGSIEIGDNVYIGSGCIFNPDVTVANAIHIGGGSVISKSLEKPGMYVGQGLRYIENDLEKVKSKLKKVEAPNLVETVYVKE
tara:strand:+ start:131500 stop:132234 length:735 start_codon:yes stop_codon:yes gene_type:complete